MPNSKYFKSINANMLKVTDNKPIFKTGNLKIGYDTIIFNLSPAKDCISRKKGLCQLPNTKKCYALRDEIRYKHLYAYRLRQKDYWNKCSVHQFIIDIGNIVNKSKIRIKYLRFNESGDITLKDLSKINFIAKWLYSEYNIITYLYTARYDLKQYFKDYTHVVINGSGFMVDNSFIAVKQEELKDKKIKCLTDCTKCTLCKYPNKNNIYVGIH